MTLLWLAAAWLIGLGAAALGLSGLWPLLPPLAAGIVLGATIERRWRLGLLALASVLIAAAGMARYEAARPPEHPGGIASLNDGTAVHVRGTVTGEPEEREASQRFVVEVEQADRGFGFQPSRGNVLVTTRPYPKIGYGDQIDLRGKLTTPPSFEGFDYREYLARRGIDSLASFPQVRRTGEGGGSPVGRAIASVRGSLGNALDSALPEPEAALARGILIGQRASIPRDLTNDLNRAGISHLVAISGYNVTLVAGLGVASLTWLLGRRRATIAAMVVVVLFVLLVGASPSVLRAAVMGIIMLGATLAGRPGSALTAVALAAAFLTGLQPLAANDISFQLSFAATLGLIVLSGPLAELLSGVLRRLLPETIAAALAENVGVTTAASLAVLPIIAADFGRLSLIAVPANVATVAAFPLILLTSAAAAGAGVVSVQLGDILGQAAYLPLTYLVHAGHFFASVPASTLALSRAGVTTAALMYGAFTVLALAAVRLSKRLPRPEMGVPARFGPAVPAAILVLALAVVSWTRALESNSDRLRVSVLDVGNGDAVLITTPAGQRILVDGAPSGSALARGLTEELGSRETRIDLVVASNPADDELTGLISILERFDVRSVLVSPAAGKSATFREWRTTVSRGRVPVREAAAGEYVDLGSGVRLQVLGPSLPETAAGDSRDRSVVLRLVYGHISFLLPGAIGAAGEEALLENAGDLRATMLKLSRHGADSASTPAFLNAVRPSVAVISATGDTNAPSPTTERRLAGIPIYRTDENGRVRFETDGTRLWAAVERGSYRIVEASLGR